MENLCKYKTKTNNQCSFKATNAGLCQKHFNYTKYKTDECVICYDEYSETNKPVKLKNCHHFLCNKCRQKIEACPICRVIAKTKLRKSDLKTLNENQEKILGMIEDIEAVIGLSIFHDVEICEKLFDDLEELKTIGKRERILGGLCVVNFKRFYEQSLRENVINNEKIMGIIDHISEHVKEINKQW